MMYEILALFGVLVLLAVPATFVLLWISAGRLRGIHESLRAIHLRLTNLEKRIGNDRESPPASGPDLAVGEPQVSVEPTETVGRPVVKPPAEEATAEPVKQGGSISEVRVGQRGLLIAGIVILLLGFGYFLQYSFQQGWVSPALRVLLTYAAGLGLLGAGDAFRRRSFAAYGLALSGGGVAALYFATFAGFGMYELFAAIPAFVLMLAVTALAGVLSVRYDNRWLAVLGLVGGFITPLLIRVEDPSAGMLFLYLIILNGGVLGVAFFRQWNLLHYLGAAATWLVFALWFWREYTPELFWLTLTVVNLFFLTYALAPTVYFLRRHERSDRGGWSLAAPNTFVALAFGFVIIEGRYSLSAAGLLTLAYGAFFVGFAVWIMKHRPRAELAFTVSLVKAMVFTGLTVPVVFSGPWIAFFWALLGGALAWAAGRLRNPWLFCGALAVGALSLSRLYLYDYPVVFGYGLFDGWHSGFRDGWYPEAGIRLLLVLSVLAALILFRAIVPRIGKLPERMPGILSAVALAHLFLALNVETRGLFLNYAPNAANAAISMLWAVFSISLIAGGFRFKNQVSRMAGILLFGVTVLKVLSVDMAETATPYRILSSIVLGVIMIAASFLYYRFKDDLTAGRTD